MAIDRFAPDNLGLRAQMLLAANGLRFSAVAFLRDEGVPARWLAEACGAGEIGRARVTYSRDRDLFELAEAAGETAIILPVTEDGIVTDLVAFDPRQPDGWALRCGNGLMLGWDLWHANAHAPVTGGGWAEDPAVKLYANPLQWLRGGGDGLCLLVWTPATMAMLRALGPNRMIVCEDERFAAVVEEKMAERQGLPAVRVSLPEMTLEAAE